MAERINEIKKDIDYYMRLPYNIVLQEHYYKGDHCFLASVVEINGCYGEGATYDDAYTDIREKMRTWIRVRLERGDIVPEPIDDASFSGKLNLRIPRSLHKRLAIEAAKAGVPLKEYAIYKLSSYIPSPGDLPALSSCTEE